MSNTYTCQRPTCTNTFTARYLQSYCPQCAKELAGPPAPTKPRANRREVDYDMVPPCTLNSTPEQQHAMRSLAASMQEDDN